jgi:hypothetical protein
MDVESTLAAKRSLHEVPRCLDTRPAAVPKTRNGENYESNPECGGLLGKIDNHASK